MTDIVGVFNGYTDTLGWYFTYGNKSNQNLLQSDMINDAIYFLLDPVTRSDVPSRFGGVAKTEFTGSFMLVVKSDLDNTYDNTNTDEMFRVSVLGDGGVYEENVCNVTKKTGKYELNIKPLLNKLELLKNIIECDNYNIDNWTIIDVIDALDVNMDGLIVTYKISKL